MAEIVLVTGGTGYVAGWCIVDLLKRDYAVRATVRDVKHEVWLVLVSPRAASKPAKG